MSNIHLINRVTKKIEEEQKAPLQGCLEFLYGKNPIGNFICHLLCKVSFFSKFFGKLQDNRITRKRISPFIQQYQIDVSEFASPVETFSCFNDFFTRKLKPEARPIASGSDIATLPADGRYVAYQNIQQEDGFIIKGKKFSLEKLLQNNELAKKYEQGSMVIVRLAPVDYHRFHFPCNCIPSEALKVEGALYSVNPIAWRKNIGILTENKRVITHLKTQKFGTVLYVEIGATFVGSIIQTFTPNKQHAKGDEKGYFLLGGSSIVLLFEPSTIQIDQDLLQASSQGLAILGKMGQSLGRSLLL